MATIYVLLKDKSKIHFYIVITLWLAISLPSASQSKGLDSIEEFLNESGISRQASAIKQLRKKYRKLFQLLHISLSLSIPYKVPSEHQPLARMVGELALFELENEEERSEVLADLLGSQLNDILKGSWPYDILTEQEKVLQIFLAIWCINDVVVSEIIANDSQEVAEVSLKRKALLSKASIFERCHKIQPDLMPELLVAQFGASASLIMLRDYFQMDHIYSAVNAQCISCQEKLKSYISDLLVKTYREDHTSRNNKLEVMTERLRVIIQGYQQKYGSASVAIDQKQLHRRLFNKYKPLVDIASGNEGTSQLTLTLLVYLGYLVSTEELSELIKYSSEHSFHELFYYVNTLPALSCIQLDIDYEEEDKPERASAGGELGMGTALEDAEREVMTRTARKSSNLQYQWLHSCKQLSQRLQQMARAADDQDPFPDPPAFPKLKAPPAFKEHRTAPMVEETFDNDKERMGYLLKLLAHLETPEWNDDYEWLAAQFQSTSDKINQSKKGFKSKVTRFNNVTSDIFEKRKQAAVAKKEQELQAKRKEYEKQKTAMRKEYGSEITKYKTDYLRWQERALEYQTGIDRKYNEYIREWIKMAFFEVLRSPYYSLPALPHALGLLNLYSWPNPDYSQASQFAGLSNIRRDLLNSLRLESTKVDSRLEHWGFLPEEVHEFAKQMMTQFAYDLQLIDAGKNLIAPQEPEIDQFPFYNQLFFSTDALQSTPEPFNKVISSSCFTSVPRFCPPGFVCKKMPADNYCFYHAIGSALSKDGPSIFKDLITLSQSVLDFYPEVALILNSVMATAGGSPEEMAAMAYVEYGDRQMWGHTGLLPLICWWYNLTVVLVTPESWEGHGALLFNPDGTWKLINPESSQESLIEATKNLLQPSPLQHSRVLIIENHINHWDVLTVEG